MKKTVFLLGWLLVSLSVLKVEAQRKSADKIAPPENYQPIILKSTPSLQTLLEKAVAETLAEYAAKKVSANDIAATLIDLRDAENPQTASVRGDAKIYPASVVKLFYLVAAQQRLENGKIKDSPEFERGLRNMIVDSSNDATDYVLDVLTDTGSGGELSAKDLKIFGNRRNIVNRYFAALGFTNINVNQKTYYEDAYGRERQFRSDGANRNMLTTGATARLLAEIVTGRAVTPERSRMMMDLLKRDFSGVSTDADDQAHGFSAIALNKLNLKDAKLWSKAGWTSKTRHDAAYLETPDGRKFVLVVFTENFAGERDIIPTIAEKVLNGLKENK